MSDFSSTLKQVVCDECGTVSIRGLNFRADLETPVRLCKTCLKIHDNHPQVVADRDFHEAMETDHDDF